MTPLAASDARSQISGWTVNKFALSAKSAQPVAMRLRQCSRRCKPCTCRSAPARARRVRGRGCRGPLVVHRFGDGSRATLSPDESENDTVDDPLPFQPGPLQDGYGRLAESNGGHRVTFGETQVTLGTGNPVWTPDPVTGRGVPGAPFLDLSGRAPIESRIPMSRNPICRPRNPRNVRVHPIRISLG